jgi:DNA-binding IclR family transcriptional regulator
LKKRKKGTSIIQSLDKGLYLLEVVEQAGSPSTLQQLWEKLRWDKATIYRILSTLERRGYISRNSKTKTYTLGMKIYGLYDSLVRDLDIQQIARQYLERLVEQTGQTAHLAVVLENSVVFIDKVAGSEVLSVNTQVGAREPMHCTALGKAFLAYVEEQDLKSYLKLPLEKFTPNTITTLAGLKTELNRIRKKGYAFDNEEYVAGVRCISCPILNQYDAPVAMLGISGPKSRISLKDSTENARIIKDFALEISKRLGYKHDQD